MSLLLGSDLPEISRAVVVGLARSGRAAVDVLLSRGVEVVANDARGAGEIEPVAARDGLTVVLGGHPEQVLDRAQLVVVSPGVPRTLPLLDAARARALPVLSEVEVASRLLPGPVVGITGTNGKSTTTALTAALLSAAGRDAIACGNLGTPWISFALPGAGEVPPGRVWVVELSSYQLEGVRTFAPDVAVHLNLTPDHLDRYRSLDDYGAAKARIFENQREAQVAILNADDPLVARISPRARRFDFSRRGPVPLGAFLAGDELVVDIDEKGPRTFARRSDLALPGAHNAENALASLAAAALFGLAPEEAAAALRAFRGLPHRTVLVRVRGGVSWYNDSKGTNVDATLKSLEGFPDGRVFAILGGKDKGDDFGRLVPLLASKGRRALLIGASAETIARSLGSAVPVTLCGTLERAVAEAAREAEGGDVVLLSPACASFDQFRNFEHRGEAFEALVNALPPAPGDPR